MLHAEKNGEHRVRALPLWRALFGQIDDGRSNELEDAERCLEAMAHWRDPSEKRRIRRCRRHSLLDDNPTSG